MPWRQSLGTDSVVERPDECSEIVSGIISNGYVPSAGPGDVVFEDFLLTDTTRLRVADDVR